MVNVIFFWQISSIILNLTVFSTIQAALSPVTLINGNTLPEIHDTCAQLISSCAEEYFGENRFRETAVFHFLVQLFLLVGRTLSDESAVFHDISPDKKRHYTEAFSSVCEYIHQHYAENLCVDTAASMTGFSKYHFLRLFKQFAGDTFYHYVNAQRIYHACLLLSDPEKNINGGRNELWIPLYLIVPPYLQTTKRVYPD